MQPKVLVTGSTGFLGAHIVLELLRSGYRVKATYRNRASIEKAKKVFGFYSDGISLAENIEWIEVDLLSSEEVEAALEGADYLVHAAAEVSFSLRRRNEIIENNTRMAAVLADAANKLHIKKMCYVSSIATLGSTTNGEPITEDTKWTSIRGNSGYSISKFYAEMEVWRAISEGLNAVIINPSIIIGPGDWRKSSPAFFEIIGKGMPFYTNGVTGFVDVRDVARAARLLLESDISSEQFIVSSENITFRSLFTQISKRIGVHPPYMRTPLLLSKTVAVLDTMWAEMFGREPKITLDSIRSSVKKHYYSGKKLTDRISFSYTPIADAINFAGDCFLQDKKRNK